ncbi:hypothetical protein Premu_0072 [Hallella multisaccharivorax DSM 17128]|uniref:Uncharacterized protein n=1 Tax=Hallella multisaccharivorax DSM 17128 TaxID=688246 RepID=F8N5A7_9BACT|nr:hypothetical protein Premu_0072 [Hallella multisaccharivorax DSM 17128]
MAIERLNVITSRMTNDVSIYSRNSTNCRIALMLITVNMIMPAYIIVENEKSNIEYSSSGKSAF